VVRARYPKGWRWDRARTQRVGAESRVSRIVRARRDRSADPDQAFADGASGQFGAVLGVQLLDDVLQMELDRVLTDAEFGRDLTVSLAVGDEPQDLRLAIGQTLRGLPVADGVRRNSSMIWRQWPA